MKRFVALLMTVVLIFSVAAVSCASAEDKRDFYNPNHYPLFRAQDAWLEDGEGGDYVLQGCFGDISLANGEENAEIIGFDDTGDFVFPLVIAEDCVIEMPLSLLELGDNVSVTRDQLMDIVSEVREALNMVDFYCEVEMNEEGELTRITYVYMPF